MGLGNGFRDFSYEKCVIECSPRDVYSGRDEFMGKGVTRHVPVKWGVRRPPPFSVYGLCGEFRVSVANLFKVMHVGGGVVSC